MQLIFHRAYWVMTSQKALPWPTRTVDSETERTRCAIFAQTEAWLQGVHNRNPLIYMEPVNGFEPLTC